MIITRMEKDTHLCYFNLVNPIGWRTQDSSNLRTTDPQDSPIYRGTPLQECMCAWELLSKCPPQNTVDLQTQIATS